MLQFSDGSFTVACYFEMGRKASPPLLSAFLFLAASIACEVLLGAISRSPGGKGIALHALCGVKRQIGLPKDFH